MHIHFSLLASAVALCFATPSLAQQNTLQLGLANVQPHSSASDFSGPFTPSGLSVNISDKSTLFFSYAREINDQWDVELALAAPPTHDIILAVNNSSLPAGVQAFSGQVGARVRQVAPTLFANYKFLEKTSPLRPFIGVGINYTNFDRTTSTAASNALNGGPTSISLKDSFGLALHGGVTLRISNQWSLSTSLATAQVKSKITTNTLGVERTADISFTPRVFTVAVGYSF